MAALNFDDYGDAPEGGTLAAALNWAGAFLSILLIAGLATWGWKLWVRDVTGVPVVRALEGPMRIAPEEPGGLANTYQGLTVNRIAEERVDVAPSERVVLAPQPAALDEDDDLAMADLPPVVAPATIEDEPGQVARLEPAPVPDSVPVVAATEAPALAAETATAAEAATASAEQTAATPSATDLAVAAALSDLGLKPEPAVAKIEAAAHVPVATPRPIIRPVNLQRVSAPAVTPTGDIDPATIPVGTRLVQLGAYGSPDVARAEWENAQARFGDYLLGKERVVQEAQTGGRTFFRLRALGFADLSEARRFCAVLVAEGANCIPVVQE